MSGTTPAADTKSCPFCAEEIKAAAIKCRYCQSDLTGVPEPEVTSAPPPPPVEPAADPEPEPAAAPAAAAARDRRRPRRPGWAPVARPRLVLALAVLVVAALAFNVVFLVLWDGLRDDERARSAGQVEAVSHVERILSYGYQDFDEGTRAASRLMTPKFRKEYRETVRVVREDAMTTKAVVKAEVVASSVVDASPERVTALLFVNQTTTSNKLEQPRLDLNRVEVTLVSDGEDGWLVDNVKAL